MTSRSIGRRVQALEELAERRKAAGLLSLFEADRDRFARFSFRLGALLLDLSKCAFDAEAMTALLDLAEASQVEARRDAMFAGAKINETENRAVLHPALRGRPEDAFSAAGEPVGAAVEAVLQAMEAFAAGVRSGAIVGATGHAFTDIVNIGIGGSDLGPAMATMALRPYHDGPRTHFVSNVDGAHMADTLKGLDPARTLFIVASKTFTTIETMTNAATARRFIAEALGEDAVETHFAAVSTAIGKTAAFGIPESRVFGFWEWVGGRTSLWSAIGLPVMIAIGPDDFRGFLDGARTMDRHFLEAPAERNLPILLGLAGWWHRVACGYPTRAVIPYDQRLARLPAYLQQLDMESNGKHVGLDGRPVATVTGPVVWGEPGTNGQHAFFQLLHQGTDVVPVEFMVAANGHEPDLAEHHELLVANCLAQSEALMRGRSFKQAHAQLVAKGMSQAEADRIAPHRVFEGNRPSITLLYPKLDPFTLGEIVALYEHRVFVEAQLFGINAFDQWGVELGKELATELLALVKGQASDPSKDASTGGLVAQIRKMRTS